MRVVEVGVVHHAITIASVLLHTRLQSAGLGGIGAEETARLRSSSCFSPVSVRHRVQMRVLYSCCCCCSRQEWSGRMSVSHCRD